MAWHCIMARHGIVCVDTRQGEKGEVVCGCIWCVMCCVCGERQEWCVVCGVRCVAQHGIAMHDTA